MGETISEKKGVGVLPLAAALRSNCIKYQRTLPGTGDARKDDQFLLGKLYMDMAEIILTGIFNNDLFVLAHALLSFLSEL